MDFNFLNTLAENVTPDAAIAPIPKDVKSSLLKPSADAIGNALGILVTHFTLPAIRLGIRDEQNVGTFKSELSNKINEIPDDRFNIDRIGDVIELTAVAVNKIDNETFRHMFSTLIANTLDLKHQDDVRLLFGTILRNLEPKDAQLLRDLNSRNRINAYATAAFLLSDGTYSKSLIPPFQIISIRDNSVTLVGSSLQVLESFGLLKITDSSESLTDKCRYQEMEASEIWLLFKHVDELLINSQLSSSNQPAGQMALRHGFIEITQLGQELLWSAF